MKVWHLTRSWRYWSNCTSSCLYL